MKGSGILRGLGITLKHFLDTYLDDIKWGKKRYYTDEGIQHRRSAGVRGVFTVQYPEEKLPIPEEFRYFPILVYEENPEGGVKYRCTACGICAKVCPPQCIWITRDIHPKTGRPAPSPKEFTIDIDLCMSCGMCAEFCPFDSIKMDHDYEIASSNRLENHILNLEKLGRSLEYYSKIRPINYAKEEAIRAAKIQAKLEKQAQD